MSQETFHRQKVNPGLIITVTPAPHSDHTAGTHTTVHQTKMYIKNTYTYTLNILHKRLTELRVSGTVSCFTPKYFSGCVDAHGGASPLHIQNIHV